MATHKTKTFELGTIDYRMPNIVECMRLLGLLGFARNMAAPDEGQEFIFVSRLIDNMKPFILKIEAIKGEAVITEWDDALEHMEFMAPLSQIAGEILEHLNPGKREADRKN